MMYMFTVSKSVYSHFFPFCTSLILKQICLSLIWIQYSLAQIAANSLGQASLLTVTKSYFLANDCWTEMNEWLRIFSPRSKLLLVSVLRFRFYSYFEVLIILDELALIQIMWWKGSFGSTENIQNLIAADSGLSESVHEWQWKMQHLPQANINRYRPYKTFSL